MKNKTYQKILFTNLSKAFSLNVSNQTMWRILLGERFYSTNKDNINNLKSVVVYSNTDTQKELIFGDNKGKSGVYLWTNKLNGNTYVGSAIDLRKRFYHYYSLKLMELYLKKRNSSIYSALIKYGHSNFSLEILEYCEPSQVIEREQFYIDSLSPVYNILSIAGSKFGFKHSDETKELMRIASLAEKNPLFGKKHSEKTKALMSAAQKSRDKEGFAKTMEHKAKISKSLGHKIEITDVNTNTTAIFDTIGETAKYLGSSHTTVSRYIKNQTLFKGKFRIVDLNSSK